MRDPLPENMAGQKVETHEFSHQVEHSVNWGHVVLAVVALLLAWRLGLLERGNDEEDGEYTRR